jgi:8-oxo-dGTP pyrophosphatase MutT (NUDIX family)
VDSDTGWACLGAAVPPLAPCAGRRYLVDLRRAIDDGETAWQAAVRETAEEIRGINVGGGTVTAELEAACPRGCGWTYTTFAVRVEPAGEDLPRVRVAHGHAAWETAGLAWVPADRVAEHDDLHPGLRAAWRTLSKAITV